jgi:hypothetical protein
MTHTDCLKGNTTHDCICFKVHFSITLVVVGSSNNLLIELDKELGYGFRKGVSDVEFYHDGTIVRVVSLDEVDETIRGTRICRFIQDRSKDRIAFAHIRRCACHNKYCKLKRKGDFHFL